MASADATSEDPAIILAGPPTSVSGFATYHNSSDADVTIDKVEVGDPDGGKATLPVEPVTVSPGRSARIAVRLSFDPQTVPGEYPLDITLGGSTSPGIAYVAASRELALSPDVIVVDNIAAAEVMATVVVANDGNVPAVVADFGAVPLYREDAALSTMLALAKSSGLTGPPDIDPLPAADASITITTKVGAVSVAPGTVRGVALHLEIPADLPQTTRFLAALPISVRTLLIAVVPAGSGEVPA